MKNTLLFCFFLLTIPGVAQEKKVYYAIDGSNWTSVEGRNEREDLLWDGLDIDIKYLYLIDKLTKDDKEIIEKLHPTIKDLIATCRDLNSAFEGLYKQKAEMRVLAENKVIIEKSFAKNKEVFYWDKIRDFYDINVDYYNFLCRSFKKAFDESKDKKYNFDLQAMVNYYNRCTAIHQEMDKVMPFLEDILQKAKQQSAKTEKKSDNKFKPEFYYAIDGKQYKTIKGRDNYEKRLKQKMVEMLNSAIEGRAINKTIADEFNEIIADLFIILDNVRIINSNLSAMEDPKIKKQLQQKCSNIDLTACYAINKEKCYLKEVKDVNDGIIGSFDILEGIIKLIWKAGQKNIVNKGKTSGKIVATLDLQDQTDKDGNNMYDLLDKSKQAMKTLSQHHIVLMKVIHTPL